MNYLRVSSIEHTIISDPSNCGHFTDNSQNIRKVKIEYYIELKWYFHNAVATFSEGCMLLFGAGVEKEKSEGGENVRITSCSHYILRMFSSCQNGVFAETALNKMKNKISCLSVYESSVGCFIS